LALLPDGKTLVTGGGDGSVRFWDAKTGKQLRRWDDYGSVIDTMTISTDGKLLAAGGLKFSVRLLDNGDALPRPQGNISGGVPAVLSPDGKVLAYATNGLIVRCEVSTGKMMDSFRTPPMMHALASSPDGKLLATGGYDNGVYVYQADGGKLVHTLKGHNGRVFALAFSEDGKILASGSGDSAVLLWDVEKGKQVTKLHEEQSGIRGLAFTTDGKFVVTAGNAGLLHLWHVESGKLLRRFQGHIGASTCVTFSKDGNTVYSGGEDGAIRIWESGIGANKGDPPKGEPTLVRETRPLPGHCMSVQTLSFSADGKTVQTFGIDRTVRRWDAATGEELSASEVPLKEGKLLDVVAGVLFHPDGRTAILACRDNTIRICDVATGKELQRGPAPAPAPSCMALSPGGRTLAFASAFGYSIHLYDAATLKERRRWAAHHDGIISLAFSPVGKSIVSNSQDRTTRLWDVATCEEREPLSEALVGGRFTLFSPDGATLVTSGSNDVLDLWDVTTGRKTGELFVGGPQTYTAAFSPDGQYLAAAHHNRVSLIELATGREVTQFEGNQHITESLSFSPDGRVLGSGGHDGTVLLWDVTGVLAGPKPVKPDLTAKGLDKLWDDLASADAAGYRAFWALTLAGGDALPLLRDKLQAAAKLDDTQVQGLIESLGDSDSRRRDQAEAKLEQLGPRAEPALRQALTRTKSSDLRRRIRDLLANPPAFVRTPTVLRDLRAFHVIERLAALPSDGPDSGTARAANELLDAMGEGEPAARLTQAARSAKRRLGRPAPDPEPVPAAEKPLVETPVAPPARIVAQFGSTQFKGDEIVSCVTFAPDGKTLAFAVGGSVRIWDSTTGKELHNWKAPVHVASGLAFSPDGSILSVGGLDNAIHRWETDSGKELALLRGHKEYVSGLVFSKDGKVLASASGNSVRLWDAESGKQLLEMKGHGPGAAAVALSPDDKWVASSGNDGKTLVRDAKTGEEQFSLPGTRGQRWLAFSPDGKHLAATSEDRGLVLWEVATGKEVPDFKKPRLPTPAFSFSSDGKWLAVALTTGELTLLDAKTGERGRVLKERGQVSIQQHFTPDGRDHLSVIGYADVFLTVAFSSDGKRLAAAGTDHRLRIWDAESGKQILPPPDTMVPVRALAFSPDGGSLLLVGADHRVRTLDRTTGKEVHQAKFKEIQARALVLSSGGRWLAVNDALGNNVFLRDTAVGKESEKKLVMRGPGPGNFDDALAIGLSPDGKTLGTAGFKAIRLVNTDSLKLVQTMEPPPRQIYPRAIGFSPDGRTIAVSDTSRSPSLFDVKTGVRLPECQGRFGSSGPPVFSADGHTVYAGGSDRFIYQWETATGRFRGPVIESPVNGVNVLALAADGQTLASAGADHVLYLWDTASCRSLGTLFGHGEDVQSLAFSPDGKYLASGAEDGMVIVWEMVARPAPNATKRAPDEIKALWDDLAGVNAIRAQRAVRSLTECKEQSLPFFEEHLKPAAAPDDKKLAAIFADLDAADIETRKQSEEVLKEMGPLARPLLRKALEGNLGKVARQRIEDLLAVPERPLMTPERILQVRAVEVLEHMDSPASRRLLEKLAKGAEGDPLTIEAQAACGRRLGKSESAP
jgi:WD40 repeat protein